MKQTGVAATFLTLLALVVAACRHPSTDLPDAAARACGLSDAACGADAYCAYTPRLCGKGKRAGVCTKKPLRCESPYSPVCGCDGHTYDSECAANAAGVDLSVNGGCGAKLADWMPCGAHYCDARTSYCEIVLSDVFELPTDSTCKPLPAACVPANGATPSCDCFPSGTRCRSFCGPIETGGLAGFHLTCRS